MLQMMCEWKQHFNGKYLFVEEVWGIQEGN